MLTLCAILARLRARIALAERRWNDALADVDERQEGRCRSCAWLIRAMAYDGRGDRDSAIVLYERYASRLEPDALNTPSVIRRLGEQWEQKGDVAKALVRYRQFVGLWKKADPELQPQVADVARRIARLPAGEARRWKHGVFRDQLQTFASTAYVIEREFSGAM